MREMIVDKYKEGLSASQIAAEFGVGIHYVYNELRRGGVVRRNRAQANENRFRRKPMTFSVPDPMTAEQRALEALAVGLYWGEGAKYAGAHVVDLANTDVAMLQVFLKYLRAVLFIDESKLRFRLFCFDDQDPMALMAFWSTALKIPTTQFTKPYVRVSSGRNERRMPNGVGHVVYNDKKLLEHLLRKIESAKTDMGRW